MLRLKVTFYSILAIINRAPLATSRETRPTQWLGYTGKTRRGSGLFHKVPGRRTLEGVVAPGARLYLIFSRTI